LTELLGEFKRRKGSVNRGTTDLIQRASPTPSPNEDNKRLGFGESAPGLRTPVYEFDTSSTPSAFLFGHGPTYILLVEDNLINQRILAQQLRKGRCTVSTADNGLEAVQFVRQSVFARWPESSKNPHPDEATEGGVSGSTLAPKPAIPKGTLAIPKLLSIVLMDIEVVSFAIDFVRFRADFKCIVYFFLLTGS
jgi:CheY-like chemotaxis protein